MDRLFVAYGNASFGTHLLLTRGQRSNSTARHEGMAEHGEAVAHWEAFADEP
jgi:hypothetical protein